MGLFSRRPRVEPETKSSFEVTVYQPDGLKGVEFSQSLVQSLTYGNGFYCNTYGAMYRRQPAVRAVVDFLARNIAQLNGKTYERLSDTNRMEVNDHPLSVLLRNPNPRTTRYLHMFSTVADIAIYDRAYWRIIRRGRTTAVVRLSPAKLSVDSDASGRRIYRLDGEEIPRSELVVFPGYSPDSDAEGISPLETLRRVLQEEQAMQESRMALGRNAVRAGGVISRPANAPEWSTAAHDRFRAGLDLHLSGPANAGKVMLLEDGMTWSAPSFDAHHEEYVASRRLTYEEVAIVYFGPIGGRAWLDTATATASAESHKQMYQDVLGPFLRYLQDEIELQLLPVVQPVGHSGIYFEFNLADKLKGSFEEQARIATTATGVPTVAVNESRARMNLPPLDDPVFDMPVMPLNVMYGGQPAETIPTADPSTPPAPELMSAPPSGLKDLVVRFFDRQAASLASPKGRAADRTRWDRELARDLLAFVPGAKCEQVAAAINAATFRLVDSVESSPQAVTAVFEMTKNVRARKIAADCAAFWR